MYGYIYKTTNLINNKIYIGQHKSNKFDKNYFGSGKVIKQALKHYGRKNFEVILIEECQNQSEMNAKEIYWIKIIREKYDHTQIYNIADGGYGWVRKEKRKLTEEEKKIISERTKIAMQNPEIKRKISESGKGRTPYNVGKKMPQEQKDKISKKNKEIMNTPEIKEKLSKAKKGKSPWNKGLTKDDPRVLKYANKLIGHNVSDETRKKISDSLKNKE